jgi:chromosome segregation ATPase
LNQDLNESTKSVRFAHDYFQKGRPELLHRIQRSTRANDCSSNEIRPLKDELSDMKQQLDQLSIRMDNKLEHMTNAIEADYKQRMAKISFYYEELSKLSSSLGNHPSSRPSSPPNLDRFSLPHSPRSTMCPLMTLSGVAAMIVGSEKANS